MKPITTEGFFLSRCVHGVAIYWSRTHQHVYTTAFRFWRRQVPFDVAIVYTRDLYGTAREHSLSEIRPTRASRSKRRATLFVPNVLLTSAETNKNVIARRLCYCSEALFDVYMLQTTAVV